MSGKTENPKAPRKRSRPREDEAPLEQLPPELLSRLSESVARARSSAEAIKDHLALAQELSRARLAFVSSWDSAKCALVVAEVRGRADAKVVAVKPGEGPIGKAFASKESCGDADHLAIPLFDGERIWGALSLVGVRRAASPALWRAFAAHLSSAAEAAQAREAAVRRTRDLETAVAGLKSLERARDELLGSVSHELKSPLTTIKAYLSMARQERYGPLSERSRHAFEVCDRNADRLLRLINDMLLMARLQGGQMTLAGRPFGLRALVQEVLGSLKPLSEASGVGCVLEKGAEVFVKGDRERLLEAVSHLIENAILYNQKGGRARVRVEAEGGVAALTVEDTGSGIAAEDLPHIFDRFYRGRGIHKAGGAGLGLAIVAQVAQLHGGTATAKSVPGEGSSFRLTLPLFAGAVADDAQPLGRRDGAILVVEDDADCREVLCEVLSSEGLPVTSAKNAETAIARLEAARPALVLLDLHLGDGDGRQVLEHVRHDPRMKDTPVFVISGTADSAAGFRYDGPERIDAFFEKPLNLPRLLDRVRSVVRPAAATASP